MTSPEEPSPRDRLEEAIPAGLQLVAAAELPPLMFSYPEPFDPSRIEPIVNFSSVAPKPRGGLWLSPAVGDPGGNPSNDDSGDDDGALSSAWATHLDANSSGDRRAGLRHTPIRLIPDALILRVDSHADWIALAAAFPETGVGLARLAGMPGPGGRAGDFMKSMAGDRVDFVALSQRFDALWVTARALEDARVGQPALLMWGCESVLVLRAEALDLS